MSTEDFYNILGIARGCSDDDIRRAYRTMARQWHPDVHGGAAPSHDRIAQINEAYRVLSDPQLRARYDRSGPLFTPDGRPPGPEQVQSVLSRVWQNLTGGAKPAKGRHLKTTVTVELASLVKDTEHTLLVDRMRLCDACGGRRAQEGAKMVRCTPCGGTGRTDGPRLLRAPCVHCASTGRVPDVPCAPCKGTGARTQDDRLIVRVPAGARTGQTVLLRHQGNQWPEAGPAGDLTVAIEVAPTPVFRRDGGDVHVDVPVAFDELLFGADVAVPTLTGTSTIRIAPRTAPGHIARLSGQGLPVGGSRGAMMFHLMLEWPDPGNADEERAMRAWAARMPPTRYPLRSRFDKQRKNSS